MYGLKSSNGVREGPAQKATGFLTNSVCIAEKLKRRCPNRKGEIVHEHIVLEGGRTRAAQVYPRGLCEAISKGLQEQIQMDEKGQFLLMNLNSTSSASSKELHVCAENIK